MFKMNMNYSAASYQVKLPKNADRPRLTFFFLANSANSNSLGFELYFTAGGSWLVLSLLQSYVQYCLRNEQYTFAYTRMYVFREYKC